VLATLELLEAEITLSTEQGFTQYLAQATILRGWTLVEEGRGEEGIAQMRQGLVAYQATGAQAGQPYFLALLAEAYGNVGRTEEGLNLLTEALTLAEKSEERCWEAELHRLTGELLQNAACGVRSVALIPEECFQRALDIARHQQAKSLELRAAMSLSRLWQQQNKRDQAYRLLAGVYNWFTEGFDTADLQRARVLLEELEA
jgi:predicted ATPase